ncbi:uncharacterized protein VTP21DRAFT_8461 [Calcarisporiella thermophila]|uniref:uncharacterized protein n=1 Tax=Calcarisporiella thermophila TaxID=911321 RepID=UPI003744AD8B
MSFDNLFDVKDKVVLVTGGSRGIGEMIAAGFVAKGSKVYITSRSAKACDEVATRLNQKGPGQCISIPADLQKQSEINRLADELKKREQHLDVLINNAGANWAEPLDTYSEAGWNKVLNLNASAPFFLTQAMLPLLTAKGTQENPSRVIMIGSVDGIRVPIFETFAYSSAKSALHHVSRHLSAHLAPRGVTVNVIAPGPFESKMMAETMKRFGDVIKGSNPLGRIGTPEDIAGTCIYLASRAGAYTNGSTIVVDGGSLYSTARL